MPVVETLLIVEHLPWRHSSRLSSCRGDMAHVSTLAVVTVLTAKKRVVARMLMI